MAQRTGRNVHGILLLNKPVGISSNAALQRVKRLFHARKAGHTGSLDVLASGLLPICLGEATKLSGFLLNADKFYQAEFTLGVTTTTGDACGSVKQTRPLIGITSEKINAAMKSFLGPIQQIPPMYSAIKQQGQALYKLAHQGKVVERSARSITIYDIEVVSLVDNRLCVDVHCSKGTYIRTLAEDFGEALGCGAYVSALHRTRVGDYHDMLTFEILTRQPDFDSLDSLLLPMHTALSNWTSVWLTEELAYYVQQGQAVQLPQAPTSGLVKLFVGDKARGSFIGIGHVLDDGRIAPRRLINAN